MEDDEKQQISTPSVARLKDLGFIIAPLSIGLFPVLSLYARNVGQVSPDLVVQPILVVVGVTALLMLILNYFFKSTVKSSIIISFAWIFFYAYIPMVESGYAKWPNLVNLDSYLLPIWALIFSSIAFFVIKSSRKFNALHQFLTVAGLVVVVLQLFTVAQHRAGPSNHPESIDKSSYLTNNDVLTLDTPDDLPNIYYILLDSYPRSDTLESYFNFSNDEFDSYLEMNGFDILSGSHSNYNHTGLTVPATLNMSYFKKAEDLDIPLLLNMYRSNNVFDTLRNSGYKIINNSTFFATVVNEYADFNVDCNANNEFLTELLGITALKPLSFVSDTQRNNKRDDALCTIDNISATGGLSGNKFVFTHLLPPHPPYLFDRNGNDTSEVNLSLDGWTRWLAKEPYIEQLIYINTRIEEAVDGILASNPNSIIIIQSDHGTLSSATEAHNLSDTREVVLIERARNYSAVYLPNSCDKTGLYESMTNVNTFRVIFNSCFDANLPLLEDRVYYAEPNIYTAPFRDITPLVNR